MNKVFAHTFDITLDHPGFEGHFPTFPVLPAVAQLSLLADTLTMFNDRAIAITAIPIAKFLRPVTPDTAVTVEVRSNESGHADFIIRNNAGVLTKGKVNFEVTAT